ncbi:response regulator [Flavobacterium bizetiae]|uniref:Autoinducer 1 sensor kinase/phosphatase LuxN n=1 Tax=Flavobacterium bizetiae TaxID=2704140 RepID=A0A6J4GE20_9FLAO|nr:response regulator [Flavobacterium bizetiae]CAA9196535.1 Autoinducer 1 sensor kinase/phosphatase LuxN [Flavobacterium bizetiae]CAD5340844.1 Autoinducer 1 sensor kinase/phosphatase LuxN [Flavobacterium bizetiae]CAD5347002.1 Autoinducer 1 sensor kinase/phosphatase LuxN [Flavobacterium bizetiae]
MQLKPVFLVIEDNLIDQLVITQLLTKGMQIEQIVIANNGKEGIEWLTTQKKNQSLIILLDIQMPIMNGFEFLDAFHKLNKEIKKETQIYVLSSTLDPEELEHINKNDDVSGFLNKPFPIEEFKRKFS